MFILLAGAFILGFFLGVLIICLLIIAKESRERKILPGSERALTSVPYNY
jgi:hypothetical protein